MFGPKPAHVAVGQTSMQTLSELWTLMRRWPTVVDLWQPYSMNCSISTQQTVFYPFF